MKNLKRMFALVLALMMVLALAACGQTAAPAATESPAAPQQDAENEPASETTTDWPTKPIEIIVSASAGGDCDANARILAEALTRKLGVSVVVSNVTGSGSVVGNRQAKDSDPDGYTLLLTHEGIMINKAAGLSDFDIHDYDLVGTVGKGPGYLLATGTINGFEKFQDMIDYSQEHPGELSLSVGTGSTTEVMGFMAKDAGADLTDVDFGDAAQKLAGLVGGQLDATFLSYAAMQQYIETGEMVSLGLLADERSPFFPDEPTMIEQGFEAMTMQPHYLLAFPKGVDTAIFNKMRDALIEIINEDEAYREALETWMQLPYFEDAESSYAFYDSIYDMSVEYYARLGA